MDLQLIRREGSTFFGLPMWYSIAVVITCALFVATQSVLAFAPLGLFFVILFLAKDIRRIYFAMFLFIPLSTEVYLAFGLGTDVPTEQCMWLLTGIGFLLFIFNWHRIPVTYLLNPISLLLLATLSWIFVSAVFSENVLTSFKYLLARIWYVVSLFCMTLYFIKSQKEVNRIFYVLFSGLVFSVVVIVCRHAMEGFTYDSINFVLWPFYRNHVNYACLLAICIPFFYWFANTRSSTNRRVLGRMIFFILLVALYFTYTRAAIMATVMVPVFYFIIKRKWIMHAAVGALLVAALAVGHLVKKYNYLTYAPNFASTIQHGNFDDVLSATYRLEDLSTMERFYRWVAGYHMVKEKPLTGFGPSNFYSYYKEYTVTAFTTYVSDNPDKSGIHNYYLMLLVEQGIPGLLLFLILIFVILYQGQHLYHTLTDPFERSLILAALGSVLITLTISVMNDMLETDKVGTLFLFSLALLVRGKVLERNQKRKVG